jgi:hypothetical protein
MNRVRRELPTPEELMAMQSEPDGPHYDPSEHDEADLPRER